MSEETKCLNYKEAAVKAEKDVNMSSTRKKLKLIEAPSTDINLQMVYTTASTVVPAYITELQAQISECRAELQHLRNIANRWESKVEETRVPNVGPYPVIIFEGGNHFEVNSHSNNYREYHIYL